MARKPPVRSRVIDNCHPMAVDRSKQLRRSRCEASPRDTTQSARELPESVDGQSSIISQITALEAKFERLKVQVRQAQQLASLGTAAAMFAHEVNNLLTPLQAYAQTALENNNLDLQKKALTVTLKSARVLEAMSGRFLELSAAKSPTRQSISVRTAVDDAAASLCRDLTKDGIRLVVDVDPSVTAWADPLQLQQVLFNLFLNARDAMAPLHKGRLTVSAAKHENEIVIDVQDTGNGIAPDSLPHIFDPLQSSKSDRQQGRHRCAGLGLALCRDLVGENHGTIRVASEEGVGTTFTITLPTAETEG